MEPIKRVNYIFQTIETLPKAFVDEFCGEVLESIQGIIKLRLSRNKIHLEDFSKEQFQDVLNCMALFKNDESSNEEYHRPIRNCLIEEDIPIHEEDRNSVLQHLCNFSKDRGAGAGDEQESLITLKLLREMKFFYKEDVYDMSLLHESFFNHNELIFHYLVEWNPTGLKSFDRYDEGDTVLQESIYYGDKSEDLKTIIKAGLKYLPNELGSLLFTIEGNESPYALLMGEEGTQKGGKLGWTVIEECFEEVEAFNLYEPNPDTSLYPFMFAACDQSCPCVDLVYYLLRKDPCVLLQFNPSSRDEEIRREEGTSRKRIKM